MKYQKDLVAKNKNILVRVDLNVPIIKKKIIDNTKIVRLKKTIKDLSKKNNKIFLISHLGRPKGKKVNKYSLKPLTRELEKMIKSKKIHFIDNYKNTNIKKMINNMKFGEICLFENIRFYKQEEKNDKNFSKKLSKHFHYYINDAFSASHRKHSSIVSIANYLPSFCGFLFTKEILALKNNLKKPVRPSIGIIGGFKISTKIGLLKNLAKKLDYLIIGGGMANTFLAAKGYDLGNSYIERKYFNEIKKIEKISKKNNCKIILPIDVVTSNKLISKNKVRKTLIENINKDQSVFDIGQATCRAIKKVLINGNTILWNGPLGAFEYKPFNKSTLEIGKYISHIMKKNNPIIIVGGGDTLASLKKIKVINKITYASTSGGAFLEWIEGKKLPGIIALEKNKLV